MNIEENLMKNNMENNDSSKNIDLEHDYPWKKEQEEILQVWADKAKCFNIMHERAYKRFWCMNAWFNIPVIIIATITGTGNFATSSFGPNSLTYTFIIGGFNIFAGILATIATYIGAAQKCEGHRFALVHWDKFARKVQIELMKKRIDRMRVKIFMKQTSEEYDRLLEMSPILPNDIIRWFSDKVDGNEDEYTDCGICCYECFCFACGCNICTSCLTKCIYCFDRKRKPNTQSDWTGMALPEIIGKITKTKVAVIDRENPEVIEMESKKDENNYDIYISK